MSESGHGPKRSTPTSGQVGPKSNSGKFREKSNIPLHSERLHQGADSSGFAAHTEKKQIRRMEKSAYRAEKTGAKLEAATAKRNKQKPPKNPGVLKSLRRAAGFELYRYAHGKIHQVEHENVGTEAAHRTELAGESVIRGGTRFIKKRNRTRPARRVRKWEKRDIKAKADLQYKKVVQEKPQLNKSAFSRFVQKQRIKRKYQKQARQTAKRGAQAAKKTAVTTEKIAASVVRYIAVRPHIWLIAGIILLLVVVLQSCMGMFASLGGGVTGAVSGSSYLAADSDIDRAELAYTEWETDLQIEIDGMESTRPGYGEYRRNVGTIGHDPYALMAFLTAAYDDFTYDSVESVLREIFNEQYTLTTREITATQAATGSGQSIGQVRTTGYCACEICCGPYANGITASGTTATASRTIAVDAYNPIVSMGSKVTIDGVTYTVEDTGNLAANNTDFDIYFNTHAEALAWGRQTRTAYLTEGSAESRILEITLTVRPFEEILQSRMNAEQTERYNVLMVTKGNRQYLDSPFPINWLPYVTSNYGYRVHPISGEKSYHTGIDIGLPEGTDILAGQAGTVTFAGENGGYGLLVVIEDETGLVSKYAHCSALLVSAGQTVERGAVIAKVGTTGNSTGPHLHMEVLKDGQYLNPLYFAITNDFIE